MRSRHKGTIQAAPMREAPNGVSFRTCFESFEHTADLGLHVRAANVNDLFAEAGRGLFSVIVENPDASR